MAVRLDPGGVATLLVSSVEMGQGAATVLPQIAAEALGVPIERVRLHQPDTSAVPDSGPTVASRTTMVVGRILVAACRLLVDKARAFAGDQAADPLMAASHAGLSATAIYEPDPGHPLGSGQPPRRRLPGLVVGGGRGRGRDRRRHDGGAAGQADPRRGDGRGVNPVLCVGQVEGGTLQGSAATSRR